MIGERLRDLREALGLNQPEFAALAGTSKQYVSQLESGRNRTPNPEFLLKWARGARVRLEWLIAGELPREATADAVAETRAEYATGTASASQPVSVSADILRSAVELARKGMAHLGVDSIDFEEQEAAEVLSFAIDYLADDSSPVVSDSVVIDFATALEKRNGQRGKTGSTRRSDGEAGGKEAGKEGAPARRRRKQPA